MAGKPGRSGGARPGAGRKSNPPTLSAAESLLTKDPLEFLTAVMNDPATDIKIRTDAAKAMLPFKHQKLGEGGKKDAKGEAAKKAANKFASTPPPLRAVK
ncbi:hypothetical protein ACFFTM_10040 [Pseudoduganella plicata]|uniref:Terminase small subunit n=1 Tax=Pseudoduganella plicata TaxID=321984 RepID=A0A4P7BFM1_9BURK|nr:hypothetical protein [Pseudoduganella plicata]QBQ36199.1 hypothetical protein E1742_08565 [Pseudoduganella plicata]GGY77259.1 hypothetical protein GCM10007388_07550 [Pseudoduganella plicata]